MNNSFPTNSTNNDIVPETEQQYHDSNSTANSVNQTNTNKQSNSSSPKLVLCNQFKSTVVNYLELGSWSCKTLKWPVIHDYKKFNKLKHELAQLEQKEIKANRLTTASKHQHISNLVTRTKNSYDPITASQTSFGASNLVINQHPQLFHSDLAQKLISDIAQVTYQNNDNIDINLLYQDSINIMVNEQLEYSKNILTENLNEYTSEQTLQLVQQIILSTELNNLTLISRLEFVVYVLAQTLVNEVHQLIPALQQVASEYRNNHANQATIANLNQQTYATKFPLTILAPTIPEIITSLLQRLDIDVSQVDPVILTHCQDCFTKVVTYSYYDQDIINIVNDSLALERKGLIIPENIDSKLCQSSFEQLLTQNLPADKNNTTGYSQWSYASLLILQVPTSLKALINNFINIFTPSDPSTSTNKSLATENTKLAVDPNIINSISTQYQLTPDTLKQLGKTLSFSSNYLFGAMKRLISIERNCLFVNGITREEFYYPLHTPISSLVIQQNDTKHQYPKVAQTNNSYTYFNFIINQFPQLFSDNSAQEITSEFGNKIDLNELTDIEYMQTVYELDQLLVISRIWFVTDTLVKLLLLNNINPSNIAYRFPEVLQQIFTTTKNIDGNENDKSLNTRTSNLLQKYLGYYNQEYYSTTVNIELNYIPHHQLKSYIARIVSLVISENISSTAKLNSVEQVLQDTLALDYNYILTGNSPLSINYLFMSLGNLYQELTGYNLEPNPKVLQFIQQLRVRIDPQRSLINSSFNYQEYLHELEIATEEFSLTKQRQFNDYQIYNEKIKDEDTIYRAYGIALYVFTILVIFIMIIGQLQRL